MITDDFTRHRSHSSCMCMSRSISFSGKHLFMSLDNLSIRLWSFYCWFLGSFYISKKFAIVTEYVANFPHFINITTFLLYSTFSIHNFTLLMYSDESNFSLFLWPYCMACRVLVPWPGIEPRPWQWKHQVLTTGLPGNSLNLSNLWQFLYNLSCLLNSGFCVIVRKGPPLREF